MCARVLSLEEPLTLDGEELLAMVAVLRRCLFFMAALDQRATQRALQLLVHHRGQKYGARPRTIRAASVLPYSARKKASRELRLALLQAVRL